jgi:Leucine-rich repeat (LRR) protein
VGAGNRLKELPKTICDLPSLRLLDVSNNSDLTELPLRLAYVRTLENLVLDADKFKYPLDSEF